jgi:hypothetical protein
MSTIVFGAGLRRAPALVDFCSGKEMDFNVLGARPASRFV